VDYVTVVRRREPALDELALALAAEFREVDEARALMALDMLGQEVERAAAGTPEEQAEACRRVLAERHGFAGDRQDYDHPDNSMLDMVLERRAGLPILLSVVWVSVARRANVPLAGIGLPGHYVVGHFGSRPPLLLDPFAGGGPVEGEFAAPLVRPWGPHETALRMLNNLVASFSKRGDFISAIRAGRMRLELPLDRPARTELAAELRALEARLN